MKGFDNARYVQLLVPGGFMASQDGHLPLVIDVLRQWSQDHVADWHGLGSEKVVWMEKRHADHSHSSVRVYENGVKQWSSW